MIRNIIFDLDGTLADTAVSAELAMRQAAPRYGLPVPPIEEIRKAVGIANPEFYLQLFQGFPQNDILRCGREVERIEAMQIRRLGHKILFPGVEEMLEKLTASGISLYIASTGSREHVDVLLQSGEIERYFQSVHCGQPDKINMLSGIIGQADKTEWLMVGDRRIDITAARTNGIAVFGAGMGYANASESALFDRVIPTPAALIDWVCS